MMFNNRSFWLMMLINGILILFIIKSLFKIYLLCLNLFSIRKANPDSDNYERVYMKEAYVKLERVSMTKL